MARALEVDLLHARKLGWAAVADTAARSLQFLEDAFDEPSGRFMGFRLLDGSWTGGPGSNDSLGRVMLALGETIAAGPDAEMRQRAVALFGRALPKAAKVTSTRAQASVVLGCAAATSRSWLTDAAAPATALEVEATAVMRRLATDLHARFLWSAGPGWTWLEDSLTYENALIPRAIIVAGKRLGANAMLAIGLQVIDWLISVQAAAGGHQSLIGDGGWPRGGDRSRFDQRPAQATALLLAAEAALLATGHARYGDAMERAYGWFLGANDNGAKVADPTRGACSDGLTLAGVNANEGAESTLMWLMAAEHIRALRAAAARATGTIDKPAATVVTRPIAPPALVGQSAAAR